MKNWYLSLFIIASCWCCGEDGNKVDPATQTVRLVQDDAQDYMVSRIFLLKHIQANDIAPFVLGMVKRYNMNSSVNNIQYQQANQEILTVTCPEKMMPWVVDFIKKADRPVRIAGKTPDDIIRGTGITRAVYTPKYRSGQILVNIIVNAVINAGPYGSVYGWDANSNQIYWKDNTSNTEFVYEFLSWLDRPPPQIRMIFTVYEVRKSTLRDMGLDYLAWKNGPGLDLFQTGFRVFDISSGGSAALQSMSGHLGGFFFAPQFDASFIRILEQNGVANITNTAHLTVSNSDSKNYEIMFNPQLQNLIKSENDQGEVAISAVSQIQDTQQIYLNIIKPVSCIHHGTAETEFSLPDYKPGEIAGMQGTVFYGYQLSCANITERNNYGSELVETTNMQGDVTMELNKEFLLAQWNRTVDVTQTIGVPFLSRIPILKYLFGTTVTSKENIKFYMTVKAEIPDIMKDPFSAGLLKKLK